MDTRNHSEVVFFNGDYIDSAAVHISPQDRGFLFADGVYEVVRSYAGRLFHAGAHFDRLRRSLDALRITGVEVDSLAAVSLRLLDENGLMAADATVYIQVTRGAAPRTHAFPLVETTPTVYVRAAAFTVPTEKWRAGARVILVPDTRWARCDIKSLALLPNVLAAQAAAEHGADEALFVRDGVVLEGSHTSFAAVFGETVKLAPASNYILPGITRAAVVELCHDLGIPVLEFPVFLGEIWDADELMLLGTTTEVMPIVDVDGRRIGDGSPGPLTRRLQDAFRTRARGGSEQ